MILSDFEIEQYVRSGRIGISPFDPERVQPASYDMTLDRFFLEFRNEDVGTIDLREDQSFRNERVEADGRYELGPHEIVLASTCECVRIPDNMVARIEGKSSLARLGLFVHITAGFFDPGFEGYATLELFNAQNVPMILYPGMPVAQMSFELMDARAQRPYGRGATGSKYQGQPQGPVPSRFFMNFR